MTEEQLNENLIKSELQCICQDCIYLDKIAPIIREMISEEYKTGLEQSRFDKNMLEREIRELKKQVEEEQNYSQNVFNDFQDYKEEVSDYLDKIERQFIEYLENYIDALKQQKETVEGLDIGEEHILMILEEVLEKYKEIIGVKDE